MRFTDYAMFACTIGINLFSTVIMGYKTWSVLKPPDPVIQAHMLLIILSLGIIVGP